MLLFNWTLPTPNARQRPLAYARIEARVAGTQQWAVLVPRADVPATQADVEDVAPGDWEFRGILFDAADRPSPPKLATFSMPFEDPSPMGTFVVGLV